MRTTICSAFIFIVLLTSCGPQSPAAPSPILPLSTMPFPTTAPEPAPTQTATATPVIQINPISLDLCPSIVRANVTDTGVLQIIYTDSNNGLGRWREDTQQAIPIPLPAGAFREGLLIDERGVIYRHDSGDSMGGLLVENPNDRFLSRAERSELWVVDADGQNDRELVSVSFDEIKARHPQTEYATLSYAWVPHTDKIYYAVEINGPKIGSLPPAYAAFALVDLRSGTSIPLVEPGAISNVAIAPDGSQAAVLTAGTLRLIDIESGDVQFTIPSQIRNDLNGMLFRNLAYSPDSNYVIGFSEAGIVSVNATTGSTQVIPLEYTILRGSVPASPNFTWVNDSTFIVPVTNLPDGVREIIEPSEYPRGADSHFTLWRVDLSDASAQPLQTFKGFGPSAVFSPDGNLIVFNGYGQYGVSPNAKFSAAEKPARMLAGPPPDLVLADIETGRILAVLNLTLFLGWSSNSRSYIYSQPVDLERGLIPVRLYFGQVGKDPILVRQVEQPMDYRWVDEGRFIVKDGCEILEVKLSL